jgi:hypothetical protein
MPLKIIHFPEGLLKYSPFSNQNFYAFIVSPTRIARDLITLKQQQQQLLIIKIKMLARCQ